MHYITWNIRLWMSVRNRVYRQSRPPAQQVLVFEIFNQPAAAGACTQTYVHCARKAGPPRSHQVLVFKRLRREAGVARLLVQDVREVAPLLLGDLRRARGCVW